MTAFIVCAAAAFGSFESAAPEGYWAVPPKGAGTGVLVLHPWWGLNADIERFCDRLAKEGYVAYAPDLFHGKVASTIPEAEALAQSHEKDYRKVEAEVAQAAARLAKRAKGPLAVVGFSFGAYYALHLSNADPGRIAKVVVYYGTGQEDFSKSRASYLGHFAENDPFESKEGVDQLADLLRQSGRPATFHFYPKTGHWFCEPSRKDAYDEKAAELAWSRTVAFLKGEGN